MTAPLYLYAVDNGQPYSDHTIWIFESHEPIGCIVDIVAAVNVGCPYEPWTIAAAGELLRVLVPTGGYSFGQFVERADSKAEYANDDPDRPSAMLAVYERWPSVKAALDAERVRCEAERQERLRKRAEGGAK